MTKKLSSKNVVTRKVSDAESDAVIKRAVKRESQFYRIVRDGRSSAAVKRGSA